MHSRTVRTGRLLTVMISLAILCSAGEAASQPLPADSAAPALKGAANVHPAPPRVAPAGNASSTSWNGLSSAQQQALKPLAGSWNGIDEAQKRKWLAMSRNFPAWPAAEQAKLHSRMTEWAALSPKQRSQARLNFAETKKVPTEEKKARWESYQSLSPEEKRKLAAGAPSQPAGVANALKPVPAQKLAAVPQAKPPGKAASGTTTAPRQVDKNTLLPRLPATTP